MVSESIDNQGTEASSFLLLLFSWISQVYSEKNDTGKAEQGSPYFLYSTLCSSVGERSERGSNVHPGSPVMANQFCEIFLVF